jgi:YHS domain-containing protein
MPVYDAVCGSELKTESLPTHLVARRLRTTFCFCSTACKARFLRDPHRFIYPYQGLQRAFASVRRSAPEFISVPAGLLPRAYGY